METGQADPIRRSPQAGLNPETRHPGIKKTGNERVAGAGRFNGRQVRGRHPKKPGAIGGDAAVGPGGDDRNAGAVGEKAQGSRYAIASMGREERHIKAADAKLTGIAIHGNAL